MLRQRRLLMAAVGAFVSARLIWLASTALADLNRGAYIAISAGAILATAAVLAVSAYVAVSGGRSRTRVALASIIPWLVAVVIPRLVARGQIGIDIFEGYDIAYLVAAICGAGSAAGRQRDSDTEPLSPSEIGPPEQRWRSWIGLLLGAAITWAVGSLTFTAVGGAPVGASLWREWLVTIVPGLIVLTGAVAVRLRSVDHRGLLSGIMLGAVLYYPLAVFGGYRSASVLQNLHPASEDMAAVNLEGTISDVIVDAHRANALNTITADYLNATHGQWLDFVAAHQPSADDFIISVNPIDGENWGAAARSETGHCFLIVATVDRASASLRVSYDVQTPRHPCRGDLATPGSVTHTEWPYSRPA